MHILAGIIAAIGALAVLMWRMQRTAEAAKGLTEATDDLRSYLRWRNWRKKLTENRLDTITDPRIAATAMMVALAQSDGTLIEREEVTFIDQAVAKCQIDQSLATELLEHSRWLDAEVKDLDNCFMRLTPVITENCGPEPRNDLIDMLNAVAAHASDASSDQAGRSITKLRNRLI
ncbi:MAG: putative tellurite resistance protein B-like protein [Alphaproteobacteria bacterium]|jgi:uncharacterized tellurite resistance protein B-like protein